MRELLQDMGVIVFLLVGTGTVVLTAIHSIKFIYEFLNDFTNRKGSL